MNIIKDLKIIDSLGDYDRISNPSRLNVLELLPTGISWSYQGKTYSLNNPNKISALLLKDRIRIAVM